MEKQEPQKQEYQVLLFYKYIKIEDTKALMLAQKALCQSLGLKGRLLIATEGVNGTLEGLKENTEKYIEKMKEDSRFSEIVFKKSLGDGKAFEKLIVKIRPEIVALGEPELFPVPGKTGGKYIKVEELNRWFKENKKFTILDMRNDYEHKSGYFEGSVLPKISHFRELPKVLPDLEHLKNKTVVAVCTGGVRCEKGTAYLKKHGFKNIYQLHDGIVTYMEKYPGQHWRGSLYVFDHRNTMHFDSPENHVVVGKCLFCKQASENYVNCRNPKCNLHFIGCQNCIALGRGFCSWHCVLVGLLDKILNKIKSRGIIPSWKQNL